MFQKYRSSRTYPSLGKVLTEIWEISALALENGIGSTM